MRKYIDSVRYVASMNTLYELVTLNSSNWIPALTSMLIVQGGCALVWASNLIKLHSRDSKKCGMVHQHWTCSGSDRTSSLNIISLVWGGPSVPNLLYLHHYKDLRPISQPCLSSRAFSVQPENLCLTITEWNKCQHWTWFKVWHLYYFTAVSTISPREAFHCIYISLVSFEDWNMYTCHQ